MAVRELVNGITGGTALCAMPDGSTVVASEGGMLTRYDGGGGVLDSKGLGTPVGGLAAHPDGVALLAAVARRGLYEVRFGASPDTTLLAGLPGARG